MARVKTSVSLHRLARVVDDIHEQILVRVLQEAIQINVRNLVVLDKGLSLRSKLLIRRAGNRWWWTDLDCCNLGSGTAVDHHIVISFCEFLSAGVGSC